LVDYLRNGTALPAKTIAKTSMVDSSNWKTVMAGCT
jgi:hypothetical protein